jgi:5-methylcytosine-specific restriction enzyme A
MNLTLILQRLLGGPRSRDWPAIRRWHLEKQPVCQACGVSDHLQVHHIRPFHLHPELELDSRNLLTLCERRGHDCHFVFGHFHNWQLWNPAVIQDVNRYHLASMAARRANP